MVQIQPFLPTTKRPYHKVVGFAEPGQSSMSDDPDYETPILTRLTEELDSLLTDDLIGTGTDTRMEQKSESNLIGNEFFFENFSANWNASRPQGRQLSWTQGPRSGSPA